jgi:hypothetical protein
LSLLPSMTVVKLGKYPQPNRRCLQPIKRCPQPIKRCLLL